MSLKKIKNWTNKKLGMMSLALANVEKNALAQKGESLSNDAQQVQRNSQGQLADDLLQGRVTQQVMDLRWRTYKVLQETEGIKAEVIGYDENDMPIMKLTKIDKKKGLEFVKVDTFDDYPLEMVIENNEITTGVNQMLDNAYLKISDESTINKKKGKVVSATHGEISATDYFASQKNELPITIERKEHPKFKIEKHTKKLNVRDIDGNKKMLEFYTSMYPDESIISSLFISDVKKAIKNPESSTILNIDSVEFITHKSLGADDFSEYKYKILSFDKIIQFNGHYVFKFIAEPIINGRYILEDYRINKLDTKYKNKEKKK